jgi:PAS domain S-box-containing protein
MLSETVNAPHIRNAAMKTESRAGRRRKSAAAFIPSRKATTEAQPALKLRISAERLTNASEPQRRIAELELELSRARSQLEAAWNRFEERRVAQQHIEALYNSSPTGQVLMDRAGMLLDANSTFCQWVGIQWPLTGQVQFLPFVKPEARPQFLKYLHHCRAGARAASAEIWLSGAGGVVFPVELITTTIHPRTLNGPRLLRTSIIDRTEQQAALARLQHSQIDFQGLIDSIEGIVWTADARTLDILYVSGSAERMLGYTLAHWYAAEFWPNHIYVEDRERVLTTIAKVIRDRAQTQVLQYRVMAADRRTVWIRDTISVREMRGKLRLHGVAVDITDFKALERGYQEIQEQLESKVAERTADLKETVAQLETFSYTLSHDLRAPLRAMQGYAEILRSRLDDTLGPQEKDFLNRIVRSTHRMDGLVQDVLKYSRISRTPVALSLVNVEKIVADVVQDDPALQPPRAEVQVERPMQPVVGHEALLTQCVLNLLTNAVKFVPPGVDPKVRVWTEAKPDGMRLLFRDNGIGIAPRDQKRIFGVFQRVYHADTYEGTGIGLAIVHKAAERMGAKVGVESAPGQGSTFWLQFQPANL